MTDGSDAEVGNDGVHTKRDHRAPAGFFAVEAAGLHWLADAAEDGGVPVPRPLTVTRTELSLPLYRHMPPMTAAAEQFGHRLAATHAAGAPYHGSPPGTWGRDGFIGPLPLPHVRAPMPPDRQRPSWAAFYARYRLEPFRRAAVERGTLDVSDDAAVRDVTGRLEDDDGSLAGPEQSAARIHGDLWSGNVLWTTGGTVLIDPAAHGGHPETDLAMLALFGLPHLSTVLSAYHEAAPLSSGWQDRVRLHQIHPLLVHAVLFGGGYGRQAGDAARAVLRGPGSGTARRNRWEERRG